MAKKTKAAKPAVSPRIDQIVQAEIDRNDGASGQYYGARGSAAKACTFCKHYYLKPCTEKTKDSCPNYKALKGGK